MASHNHLDDALERMRLLIQINPIKQLQGANEAKTRLLIIDEVLALLGWAKQEYEPELVTPVGTYTDYRLIIDGQPRLIVEAKRVGVIAPLPKSIQRPDYTNSFLFTNYGTEMNLLLRQCQEYCVQCGVPYALATTGEVWIVLIGFKYGVEWGKLKSFVFHSLEDIFHRFGEFYGLVSREAINKNSLDDKFGSMVLIRPSAAIRPREHTTHTSATSQLAERQIIHAFFDQFMGDITRPEQTEMLKQCYVEDQQLNEFSRDLQRMLQYDAALDERDLPIESLDEQALMQALEIQTASSNPKTILLVGNVGAGKSTFVHRFIRYTARPQQHICVIIDLINDSTVEINHDRAEERRLAQSVLDKLATEFRGTIDPYSHEVLRSCFSSEVARFKKLRKALFEHDPTQYRLQEDAYIFELSKDAYSHLIGYVKYVRHKRRKVWITFDNVDRGSDSYQHFVYSFAHRLAADAGCITLITLRQDTFLEAQEAGFLDVRTSDIIFHIKPPEFRRVISKRRRYVQRLIENDELPKQFASHASLVNLLSWHINRLVLDENDSIRFFITSISLNNIRYALALLRDSYLSPHSTFREWYQLSCQTPQVGTKPFDYRKEYSRFIATLMLEGSWVYREDMSAIFNIFSVDPLEKISHFLMLRLLAYLSLERNTTSTRMSIKYEKVCNDFIFLGYQRHHVNNAIRKLLYVGLVISPNLPANPDTEAKVEIPDPLPTDMKVALSIKGLYYLKKLAAHPYYQMRVAEDTIWYNEDLAHLYIRCLQESVTAQGDQMSEDLLEATDARDIFLTYLKRSLSEETHIGNVRSTPKDWIRIVNDIVERSVFGATITKLDYIGENDGGIESEHLIADQANLITPLEKIVQRSRVKHKQLLQQPLLPLFEVELPSTREADYEAAIQEALKAVGPMPKGMKLLNSEYSVRILWVLEIAFQSGLGPLRASDIARVICEYGNGSVTASGVAHFFKNQRPSGEHTHLWKEEPKRYYTINAVGRRTFASLRDVSFKQQAGEGNLAASQKQ